MKGNGKTSAERFLYGIARACAARPVTVVIIALAVAVLSAAYTAARLDFKTSRNDLVAADEPAVKRFEEISDKFGRQTNAVVVVEGGDWEAKKAFVTDLARLLEREPDYFESLFYRIDTSSLEGRKLLFLDPEELRDLEDKLQDYGELVEGLIFEPQLERILAFVNREISEATVSHLVGSLMGLDEPSGGDEPGAEAPAAPKDPVDLSFLRSLLTEMHQTLRPPYLFESPWNAFFEIGAKFSEEGFLSSDNRRFAYLILDVKNREDTFAGKAESLKRLRGHMAKLLERYPRMEAGVTGGVALGTDEMSQAMGDMTRATLLALLAILALFAFSFRRAREPLLVMAALVMAICWTFGWVTLTIGHLTILSVAFTPILLGLGIDFGIHLLARYCEARDRRAGFQDALKVSYRGTAKAVAAGGITTALAFGAVMLADFRGIRELGFIAASGILLALAATLTVLPALLAIFQGGRRTKPGQLRFSRVLRALEGLYGKRLWVLGATVLLTAAALFALPRVGFDYNLLNLQARGTESVVWEQKIHEEGRQSAWFGVTTAESLPQLRRKEEAFKALPSVDRVDSLTDLIPDNQRERIAVVRALQPVVERYVTDPGNLEPGPADPEGLRDLLGKIKFKLRTDAEWDPAQKPDQEEIVGTRQALLELLERWDSLETAKVRRRMTPFQADLIRDFARKLELLENNVHPDGPIKETHVPDELRDRYKGAEGSYLLRVYPKGNVWEREAMENFVDQLRSVDPGVTGPAVVGYIAMDLMREGYQQGFAYALAAVVLVMILIFRRLRDILLGLIPLGLTVVWTLGLMGWTGLAFNLANVIAMPLILGIVVDDGIHVIHRFKESGSLKPLTSGSTGQAITLTSWTTMLGFGSLMIAGHYGIYSLGLLVTVPVGIAWLLSLIVLPTVLSCFIGPAASAGPSDDEPS